VSEKTRIPLAEATDLATELVDLLLDSCTRLMVAGSIRRRRPDVGDIEIVAIPRYEVVQADLFAPGDGLNRNLLSARCLDLVDDGVLAHRLDVNGRRAFGQKYMRLFFRGVALDLFSPDVDTFGVILTIRTGPADFSHRLVTPRRQGGLLPDWLAVREGRIWRGTTALVTPEEIDVFQAVGLDWIEPEDRTGREKARSAS
jgi:DNA polymerase/3'-5' exonuclease PolX